MRRGRGLYDCVISFFIFLVYTEEVSERKFRDSKNNQQSRRARLVYRANSKNESAVCYIIVYLEIPRRGVISGARESLNTAEADVSQILWTDEIQLVDTQSRDHFTEKRGNFIFILNRKSFLLPLFLLFFFISRSRNNSSGASERCSREWGIYSIINKQTWSTAMCRLFPWNAGTHVN